MVDDWDASDRKLHKASFAAINCAYPDEVVCCFFFDCDEPRYGHLSISFDTPTNNMRSVKQQERFAIDNRRRNLRGKQTWQWAKYQLSTPVLSPFNTNSGDFSFPEFAEVEFPTWVKMAQKGGYPKGADHEDDYLESNARLVMWRVTEQLVGEDAFAALKLSSPFIVGYSLHDQEEVILRLLNWPQNAKQRKRGQS